MADATEFTPETEAVVDETGRFFYPFAGTVIAEGRTTGEIREDLTNKMSEFFATPQVAVSVVEYQAQTVTITGAVVSAGRRTLTNVSTTLLDLVNEVGANPTADLSRVEIRRAGRIFRVNLLGFIELGRTRSNPVLLPGDLIRVPESAENKVFTFGEMPVGEIQLTSVRKTLLEVLAESGGVNELRADVRGIFVFRRNTPGQRGFEVYQFDLTDAAALVLAADFGMAPLDIVFVTKDPVTQWNDTINKIVDPFDSLISAAATADILSN